MLLSMPFNNLMMLNMNKLWNKQSTKTKLPTDIIKSMPVYVLYVLEKASLENVVPSYSILKKDCKFK